MNLARLFIYQIERARPGHVHTIDEQQFARYLRTLLAMRVSQFNDEVFHKLKERSDRERRGQYKDQGFQVPAAMCAVLLGVGRVQDLTHTPVDLVPDFDDYDAILTVREMHEFEAEVVRRYRDVLQMRDFPRRTDGGIVSFMAKALIEADVRSYRSDGADEDNLLAVWAGNHLLDEALFPLYGWNFGLAELYVTQAELEDMEVRKGGTGPSSAMPSEA